MIDPKELFEAAQSGNEQQLRHAINHGNVLDATDPDNGGATALILAIQQNQLACARILLHAGANPHIKDTQQQSAVYWAIAKQRKALYRALGVNPKQLFALCIKNHWFQLAKQHQDQQSCLDSRYIEWLYQNGYQEKAYNAIKELPWNKIKGRLLKFVGKNNLVLVKCIIECFKQEFLGESELRKCLNQSLGAINLKQADETTKDIVLELLQIGASPSALLHHKVRLPHNSPLDALIECIKHFNTLAKHCNNGFDFEGIYATYPQIIAAKFTHFLFEPEKKLTGHIQQLFDQNPHLLYFLIQKVFDGPKAFNVTADQINPLINAILMIEVHDESRRDLRNELFVIVGNRLQMSVDPNLEGSRDTLLKALLFLSRLKDSDKRLIGCYAELYANLGHPVKGSMAFTSTQDVFDLNTDLATSIKQQARLMEHSIRDIMIPKKKRNQVSCCMFTPKFDKKPLDAPRSNPRILIN